MADCSDVVHCDNEKDLGSDDSTELRRLKQSKLIRSDKINSSDCTLLEVAHYFKFQYKTYITKKEMIGIAPDELFTECMKFCYPSGLPSFYYPKFFFPDLEVKNIIFNCKQLYQIFIACEKNCWLKENFSIDYSTATDNEIDKQGDYLWKVYKNLGDDSIPPNKPIDKKVACSMALRMHKLMVFLRKDRVKRCATDNENKRQTCKEDKSFEKNEKDDLIKGVLYEILKFLDIQVLYNGEGRLDFTFNLDPNDAYKEQYLKVKPDALGYTIHGYKERKEDQVSLAQQPYLVFEVFGSSTASGINEPKHSLSKSSLSFSTCEKMLSDLSSADSVVETKKLRSKQMTAMKTIQPGIAIDSSYTLSSSYINQKRDDITSCGPKACSSGQKANKLYGKLALQLYGALWHRNKLLDPKLNKVNWSSPAAKDNQEVNAIFGFFVTNEFIYLAKVTGACSEDLSTKDVKLTYAHNLWFNLNKPNDRLALLCFLFNLDQIRVKQANCFWD